VAEPPDGEALSAKRQIVVVLRLLIGADGRIVHGEIIDPGRRPARRFGRLSGLSEVLQEWVDSEPGQIRSPSRRDLDRRG
jgi:hypothetical protein